MPSSVDRPGPEASPQEATTLVSAPTSRHPEDGLARELVDPARAVLPTALHSAVFDTARSVLAARRRAEEELRLAKESAEQASRSKDEFLANMGHELRTPLNGILGFADLIKMQVDGPVGHPRYLEYAETIYQSGRHLLTIIEDVLMMAALTAGRIELKTDALSLRSLVADVVRSLQPIADAKGLELSTSIAADATGDLMGDATRLKQILVNLIGNAIKFTQSGSVSIAVSAAPDDVGAGIRVRFDVRDTGLGIAEETQSRLFERFYQADSGLDRQFEGSGLGLAISKQLVELMQGEIGVISTPGEGSTFWFDLPLAFAEPAISDTSRLYRLR